MNRQERRRQEKKGTVEKFDAETQSRMKFSIELPPGLMRDDGKSSRSGQFTADNDVDLTRGMFVKMLESFGYINQQQAVVGLFAAVVNPFPKNMRGALAYAIINGTGLQIVEDEVEVCTFCEAEKLMTLDMRDDAPKTAPDNECQVMMPVLTVLTEEGENWVCGLEPDSDTHKEGKDEWLHDFEESEVPMLDTTKHAENCDARPLVEGEERNVAELQWKEITAVIVLTPQMYEPLQPKPEEEDTENSEEPIDLGLQSKEEIDEETQTGDLIDDEPYE